MNTVRKLATALIGASLLILMSALPAFAQDPYAGGKPDDVKGVIIVKDPSRAPDAGGDVVGDKTVVRGSSEVPAPSVLPNSDSGVLPFTGSDLVMFLVIGGTAVIVGSTIVRRARGH